MISIVYLIHDGIANIILYLRRSTVGRYFTEKRKQQAEYVKNQLKEDEMGEQLRIPSNSPFTGGK